MGFTATDASLLIFFVFVLLILDPAPRSSISISVLFFNTTLKKSPAISNTGGIIEASKKLFEDQGAKVEVIRSIDHEIAPGVQPDMTKEGWAIDEWPELYKKVQAALKPNGVFLLEAYTPAQLKHGTGGGNSEDVMQTKKSLSLELSGLKFRHLIELERNVTEGIYHTGIGAVVQAIASKEI